jgi:hypothetical protein
LHDHEEQQLPGPPYVRQILGVVLMIVALGLFLGWIPFGLVTIAVCLALIGAALVV